MIYGKQNCFMFTLLFVTAGVILYLFCLIQAVATNSRLWKFMLYALALVPSVVHAVNHGFGVQTLLAIGLFLIITKVILFCGFREWGDRGDGE